ncbi:MAG TPA: peroxiredoxin-like family protein, partial [Pseudonocardiaceae bacterium]|nr:peroxiredoxin-like family protein [Pseudonocardiaceae bacterium]
MVNLNLDDNYLPTGHFDLTTELARLRMAAQDGAVPAEFLAMVRHLVDEQIKAKLTDQSVSVGDPAPRFTLPNATGNHVSLDHLLAAGPAVVSFYRGTWCVFCNTELRAMQLHQREFTELGASLVAISLQTPDNSLSTAQKNKLTFEVLSDVGGAVSRSYGLLYDVPEELGSVFIKRGYPLSEVNGSEGRALPVPATF